MAWSSFKAQGQLHLTFNILILLITKFAKVITVWTNITLIMYFPRFGGN